MRIVAAIGIAVLTATCAALPAAASVEELFHEFDLFGNWAAVCDQPASAANPHVRITLPSPGLVLEDHDLGADFAINHYSVLSADKDTAERLSVEVIFQPGTVIEERQTLVFLIRNGTRRTIFNQTNSGAVRVKDGVAVTRGIKTPVLRKCG